MVGNWKERFTPELNVRFEKDVLEKLKHSIQFCSSIFYQLSRKVKGIAAHNCLSASVVGPMFRDARALSLSYIPMHDKCISIATSYCTIWWREHAVDVTAFGHRIG